MAQQNHLEQAKDVFKFVCEMLDALKWKYRKSDEEFYVVYHVGTGSTIEEPFVLVIDPETSLVTVAFQLPCKIVESKRQEMAIALSFLNCYICYGAFIFDVTKDGLYYRATNSIRDCKPEEGFIERVVGTSYQMVEDWMGYLMMLAQDEMELETFLSKL